MALARPGYTIAQPTIVPAIGGAAAASAWTDADLSAFTKDDDNGLFTTSGSSLGVESTIVLTASVHGRIDSSMDGLFFTYPLTGFDREKHYGVAVRATWGASLGGTWEIYIGVGNDADPVADGGVYLSSQLKSVSASVGGNDYGQTPTTNQSVNDARYLAGAFNYRSDRQDGSVGQSANADRSVRAGQNRSVDPGTAMSDNDQFILLGFGNQNASHGSAETLTGVKFQYQLLAHHGLD